MLQSLIIDDEPDARTVLSLLLTHYCPDVKILGTSDTIVCAAQKIKQLKPNLLFLDVEIRGATAFDLLKQFDNPDFKVIFITGYDCYALNAIKFSALDYLLKPIDHEELMGAVQKARQQLAYEQRSDNLLNLYDTLKTPSSKKNRIAVATQLGLELVPVKDIIHCEASGGYTILHLKNQKRILSSKDLKHFTELLKDYDFYRIHDAHLIAYTHISKVLNEDGGVVLTDDGIKIPIARRRKNYFMAWINSFM